jgi:UDP-N-acetylglucosamine--N-acetylmuramyl-(pentapeptide) pyrophosphoryl-undecaprenol N-acetylglucosamine transferase
MHKSKTYILAGGGTGGHLYPAIAIAQRIQELRPDANIRFVGTARGLENRVIPELGYPLSLIAVRGLARSLTFKNILVPFVLVYSLLQCFFIMLKYRPAAVIGTGGYVSGPVLFTASMLGFPTLIQEQNGYPGATTRMLANVVKRVHISFDESRRYFKNEKKLKLTGNPVRSFSFAKSREQACQEFGLKSDKLTLLIFGGSQGAQAMNSAMLESLDDLMDDSNVQIIWSTGKFDIHNVRKNTDKYADRVWVSDYISDMETAYIAADFVLGRAGALTIAELTLAGLPSILVPLPTAAANHQESNARALAASGACVMILQKELTAERLTKELVSFVNEKKKRTDMAAAAKACAFPTATFDIVESVFEIERRK